MVNAKSFGRRIGTFLGVACALVAQAVPQSIRVEGSLFNSTGAPYTGSRDLQVKVYDAASAGNLLWTSSVYTVSVTSGRFTLDFNASDTSVSSPSLTDQLAASGASAATWFEVHYDAGTAGNGVMNSDRTVTPRLRARGKMFAAAAASLDTLKGVTSSAATMNFASGLKTSVQTQINMKREPFSWITLTGSTTAITNRGYLTNSASLVGVTLPSTCLAGERLSVVGQGSGGWRISQNAGQSISWEGYSTSTGVAGYLQATDSRAAVGLVCKTDNTAWNVASSTGRFRGNYASATQVFTSSGTFTVPDFVESVTAKVWGAGGGGGANYTKTAGSGGGGAYASSVLSVTPGQTLSVVVGTGGSGGTTLNNDSFCQGAGGGGGFSLVAMGASGAVVIAGGGGGGGGSKSTGTVIGSGGAGGFTTGITGGTGYLSPNTAIGGGGGTQSAGGAAGGGSAVAGSAFKGGNGDGASGGTATGGAGGGWNACGAGGGGGYYGGGGGAKNTGTTAGAGGGGGSSYGTSGADGSGTAPGNNSDSDYTSNGGGTKGVGGAGGSGAGVHNGTAGNDGMVILKY